MANTANKTMAGTRFQTSVKLSGLELPECFTQATVSSAALTTYSKRQSDKRDQKRLAAKVAKLTK